MVFRKSKSHLGHRFLSILESMCSEAVQLVVTMVFETPNIAGTMVSKTPKLMGTMGSDTLKVTMVSDTVKGIMVSETVEFTGPRVPSKCHLICQHSVSCITRR